MLSIKRSVERVKHVRSVGFALKTGIASVRFESGKKAVMEALWKSIIESGFTPVKIESNGEVYKGPKLQPPKGGDT